MENNDRPAFSNTTRYFSLLSQYFQQKYRFFRRKYPQVQDFHLLAGFLAVIIVLFWLGTLVQENVLTAQATPQACTLESKLCPDGSTVGREGPDCKFAACPKIPPETMFSDSAGRFAFRHDSTLTLSDNKAASKSGSMVYEFSTAGKDFGENPEDYQIAMTVIDTKIPTVEDLQFIAPKSEEAAFLEDQNVEIFEDRLQMKRTYKEDWSVYKKYILYTPNLVVSFTGTGAKHELLDRLVRSFRMREQ